VGGTPKRGLDRPKLSLVTLFIKLERKVVREVRTQERPSPAEGYRSVRSEATYSLLGSKSDRLGGLNKELGPSLISLCSILRRFRTSFEEQEDWIHRRTYFLF